MTARSFTLPILCFAVLAIVGAWVGGDAIWLHYLGKPLATLSILWLAAAATPTMGTRYRRAVLAGLGLSLAGDVFLMLPGDRFVPGLVSFLLAHVCYCIAFVPGSAMKARVVAFILLAAVAGANLVGLLPLIGPELKIPVLVYVAVLASMAAFALARAWTAARIDETPRSVRFAAIGAVAFVLSDSLLAWDRFAGNVPAPALTVLASYWLAQWAIARSVQRG